MEPGGEINLTDSIMNSIRLVVKYTNMSQDRVLQLPHDLFLLNLKNAFIEDKLQTKEGREYLKKAHRLQQTEPDYKKLRQMKGYRNE